MNAILDAMEWLGLDYDEGPFYQMQRMDRYKVVVTEMLRNGQAYHCYASKEELDVMREEQRGRAATSRGTTGAGATRQDRRRRQQV